ncbi:hypothetical protein [Insolitispirillum peregrinum]|uniref:hypothetical protein n=1 Tax=Insolitispirillum peregrinum TaxID=80876 RepID=UPI00361426F8
MKKYDDTLYYGSDDELEELLASAWQDLFIYMKVELSSKCGHFNKWGPEEEGAIYFREQIKNKKRHYQDKIDLRPILRDAIDTHGITTEEIVSCLVDDEYKFNFEFTFNETKQEDNVFDYLERCYQFLYEDKDFEYLDAEFRKEAAWNAFFYLGFIREDDEKYVSLRIIALYEIPHYLGDIPFQAMLRDAIDNRIFDPKDLEWWLHISVHRSRNRADACYAFLERLYRYIYLDETIDYSQAPYANGISPNQYGHLFDELVAFRRKVYLPLAEGEIECYD